MKVGFTGTREGCTAAQGGALARYVRDTPMTEFHHGCCLGADAEAAAHVAHYQPAAEVLAYPCDIPAFFSQAAYSAADVHYPRKPPLDRNRDIVDATDVLLACPKGPEERRSGTWATVRFARKCGKPVVIFWPDGTVEGSP